MSLDENARATLGEETFAGINFREIFDKNFRVWRFLEQILRKKLSRIQNKVRIRVKKLSRMGKIQEKNLFVKSHLRSLP